MYSQVYEDIVVRGKKKNKNGENPAHRTGVLTEKKMEVFRNYLDFEHINQRPMSDPGRYRADKMVPRPNSSASLLLQSEEAAHSVLYIKGLWARWQNCGHTL